MINVVVADDHRMVVDGLKAFLEMEEDITVVGEAASGEEVLQKLEKEKVDIVILDIEMPGIGGIETTRRIREHHPEVKVIILSMYKLKDFILELFYLGVNGYILKNKGKEELVSAIQTVYRDRPHFPLEIMQVITENPFQKKATLPKLTPREKEVLCLVADALSAKEIGAQLHIERVTVEAHIRSIKGKLGLKKGGELIRYAIEHKICD